MLFDKVVVPDGGLRVQVPGRPDAWFMLQDTSRPEGKNKLHFFLEADRSTMSHARMEAKVKGYVQYYQQGLHTRKYPGHEIFPGCYGDRDARPRGYPCG